MTKLLPFNQEYARNHYYLVILLNPNKDDLDKGYSCVIYSYIDNPAVIAEIVKSCTKYEYTIQPVEQCQIDSHPNQWSINQACGYLRRLRFFKKTVVTKKKTITWKEVIEEEL